ncbi:MAG: DUF2085 domain-containing protein [Anaerolineaceae bacterium]
MTSVTPKNPSQSEHEGFVIAIVFLTFVALLMAWLRFTPEGFWEKLSAVGYSVCHQMTTRTFHVEGHAFPLCARCTGMFLGAMVGLAYHLSWGRKGSFPPLPIMYVLAFFLAAFGIDSINSFTQLLPWANHLYETTNITRIISGAGMGVMISAIIGPLFNQTAWADVVPEPAMSNFKKLINVLVVLAVLLLGIVGEYVPVMYFAAVAGGLSVFLLISVLYTILAILLLRRDGKLMHNRELVLPALIGMCFALVQISFMTLIRYSLTHSWLPINL